MKKLEHKLISMDPNELPHSSKSNPSRYKEQVFQLLRDFKSNPTNPENLEALQNLQLEIENLTMKYDEANIFQTYPFLIDHLIDLMIHDDMPSARDIILRKKGIGDDVLVILNRLYAYSLEEICIHVLSELFHESNDSTVVRVASFIDHLAKQISFQLQVVIEERVHSTQSSSGLYTSSSIEGINIGSVKGDKKEKENHFVPYI